MAIIKDDEESRSKERPVGGGTSYLGGGYSGGGGASSSPSYSQSGGGGGAGGSFTNLSSYLYGGDAQGQELGAGLAGQVDTAGEQATKDINTFGTNALSETSAKTPQEMPEDVTAYASSINPVPPPATVKYSGPDEATKFADYGQAQKSVQGVQEKIGNEKGLGSFEGIQTMLKGGKGADYTQGMSMYDTMFAKKGGKNEIAGAQQKWSGIGDALKAKEGDVTKGIGFANDQANNINQAWADAYSTAQDRTNAIQQVAAGQPGAGAGNYSSPAQVPVKAPAQAPAQAPAKTPAPRGSDKLNAFDNLLVKSLPRSETAYTLPIPSGASSKELRESAVGTLAEKAQGGINYYTGKGAKKINKWLGV